MLYRTVAVCRAAKRFLRYLPKPQCSLLGSCRACHPMYRAALERFFGKSTSRRKFHEEDLEIADTQSYFDLLNRNFSVTSWHVRRHVESLCHSCNWHFVKLTRHHCAHRLLNYLTRVVILRVMHWLTLKKAKRQLPAKCLRCSPILQALEQRIKGIRTFCPTSGVPFTRSTVTTKIAEPYCDMLCSRCKASVFSKNSVPNLLSLVLQQNLFNKARFIAAFTIARYLRLKRRPLFVPCPAYCANFPPFPVVCERCSPIFDCLKRQLHALYFNSGLAQRFFIPTRFGVSALRLPSTQS